MVKDNRKRVNLGGDLHATKPVRKVMFINIIKNYHLKTELYVKPIFQNVRRNLLYHKEILSFHKIKGHLTYENY